MNQPTLFDPPMSGYSYATSKPAHEENQTGKQIQAARLLHLIGKGINTLKQLEQQSGLPQSTVAGRVNDLIAAGRVRYNGLTEYAGRKRKMIEAI